MIYGLPSLRLNNSFNLVVPRRVELLFREWKSLVLTDRRTGRLVCEPQKHVASTIASAKVQHSAIPAKFISEFFLPVIKNYCLVRNFRPVCAVFRAVRTRRRRLNVQQGADSVKTRCFLQTNNDTYNALIYNRVTKGRKKVGHILKYKAHILKFLGHNFDFLLPCKC